jgi:hypothetical protein
MKIDVPAPGDITLRVSDSSVVTRISAQYGEITRIGRDLWNNGKTDCGTNTVPFLDVSAQVEFF